MKGNPPQCPLNLSASIRSGSQQVEAERIICFFKLSRCLGTRVIWGCNDGSHQSRLVVRQHVSSFGFGKRFQVACPLEYLGFWIPINSGAPYFLGHLLAFSCFGVFLPALHLRRPTDCCSSPSSSPALDLLSVDFFPTRECSSLTLVSFPSLTFPFAMLVVLLWTVSTVVWLERKWTPWRPDLGFLNVFACSGCFV